MMINEVFFIISYFQNHIFLLSDIRIVFSRKHTFFSAFALDNLIAHFRNAFLHPNFFFLFLLTLSNPASKKPLS